MKAHISIAGAVLFAIVGIASAQAPNPAVDSYIATAKAAAGADWAGTFLRLCIPPSAGPQATGGQAEGWPPSSSPYTCEGNLVCRTS
jgi:hypothetical protein